MNASKVFKFGKVFVHVRSKFKFDYFVSGSARQLWIGWIVFQWWAG